MLRNRALALLILVILMAPGASWAWGSDGHRIAGEIASHYLTPEAKEAVEKLLDGARWGNLADAGNWADTHARLYRSFDDALRLHYVNVDPEAGDVVIERDCPDGGCVLGAIEALRSRLRDTSRPRWERTEDLLFLVHFIEDAHQPLHIVHPDQRGGNRTQVLFLEEEMNLHRLWDSGIIKARIGPDGDWKDLAYALRMEIDTAERDAWSASLDPAAWAAEILVPARELTFEVASGQVLEESYYEQALPVVEMQLQRAGVRLAMVLNEIFAE